MTESGERSIELSSEVPGTPEEVWDLIATGPGITSWFVPTEVEGREGGAVRHDFGVMGTDTGRVLVWDPPRRVVFEGSASNGQQLAFEWIVEAAAGDTCIVRLVNTGFGPGEEWDGDYDGMSMGWRLFFENLRLQLTHFRGQRAAAAMPVAMVPGPNERAWGALCDDFGVPSSASEGETITLALEGDERWRASVEAVTVHDALRHYALVFHEPPGTGFLAAEGSGDTIGISAYVYLYGEAAAHCAKQWENTWDQRVAEES